jgi:hypothetical protein
MCDASLCENSGKLGVTVANLETDFRNGVNLILLIGMLEGRSSTGHAQKI